MLNTSEIVLRIQQLIKEQDLSASSFAEKIGVQRSSISHILSGRNKPSLDFLAKIESTFEDVSFSWLLKGDSAEPIVEPLPTPTLSQAKNEPTEIYQEVEEKRDRLSSLDKIVHYYRDGTFEVFEKR